MIFPYSSECITASYGTQCKWTWPRSRSCGNPLGIQPKHELCSHRFCIILAICSELRNVHLFSKSKPNVIILETSVIAPCFHQTVLCKENLGLTGVGAEGHWEPSNPHSYNVHRRVLRVRTTYIGICVCETYCALQAKFILQHLIIKQFMQCKGCTFTKSNQLWKSYLDWKDNEDLLLWVRTDNEHVGDVLWMYIGAEAEAIVGHFDCLRTIAYDSCYKILHHVEDVFLMVFKMRFWVRR